MEARPIPVSSRSGQAFSVPLQPFGIVGINIREGVSLVWLCASRKGEP